MVTDSLFGDYLIDSNNFKNILLARDRFTRFIQMLPKYTPKCILLAFEMVLKHMLAEQGRGKAQSQSGFRIF
jgi:hypothetical protein